MREFEFEHGLRTSVCADLAEKADHAASLRMRLRECSKFARRIERGLEQPDISRQG